MVSCTSLKLAGFIFCTADSVTRFGEFSPLCLNFKTFAICNGVFAVFGKIWTYFGKFLMLFAKIFIVTNGQISKK